MTGLLGPVTRTWRPARVRGTEQMGGPEIPLACPHCHTTGYMWERTREYGHCRTCGQYWERTRYVIGQPVAHRGNAHPAPIRRERAAG